MRAWLEREPVRLDLRLTGVAVGAWLSALGALQLSAARGGLLAALAATAAGLLACVLLRRQPVTHQPARGGRWRRGASLSQVHAGTGLGPIGAATVSGRAPRAGRRLLAEHLASIVDMHGWLVTAVLLGVTCGAAATATQVAVRDAEPLNTLARARAGVSVELVVRDDPRPVSAVGRPPLYLLRAELRWVQSDAAASALRVRARILVLAADPGWRQLLPGQRLSATGRLQTAREGDLRAAVLSAAGAPVIRGQPSWPQRAAGTLRAGLQRACADLPAEPGGLLPGLVVGDTSRLLSTVEEDFQITGMTHLTAVSGANVLIVIGCVLFLARWARAGPRLAAAMSVIALVGFVILARPSPSVVRAGVMGLIGLLALASGRARTAMPALAATVVVLVVYDPELAGDAGFALSVLATSGLLVFAGRWRDALRRGRVPAGLAEALAVPAAAQVACAPVIAGLSGTVSLVAVPANLLAAVAVAPATVLGVVAALMSPIWPAAAGFVAWLGGWFAWWLVLISRYGAQVPAGTVPWPSGTLGGLLLAGLTVSLLVAARRALVRRLVAVVAAAAVLGALPVRLLAPGWPPAGWVLVSCAVGQGDAVVLPVGPAAAVVVDAGPEPAPVDRCLRGLGIRRVPLLLISHFHADHVGGIEGVFRDRAVSAVVTSGWPEPSAGRERVWRLATARGTPVSTGPVGWSWVSRRLQLRVIGPLSPALTGTRSDSNNNSLVVRATVDGVDVLLTGDAETEEQESLRLGLAAGELRADLLKLAHHGSAFQDIGFLEAVDPSAVFVSVGAENDYGHPNAALLARLSRDGARVLRTDRDGDLAAVRDGQHMAVVARAPPAR